MPSASPHAPTELPTPTPITGLAADHSETTPVAEHDLSSPPSPRTAKKRKAEQSAAKASAQPAKRVKKSSARSNTTVQAQVQGEDGATPVLLDPALRSAEPIASVSSAPVATAPAPKRPRKGGRKKKPPVTEEEASPQHDLDLLDRQLAAARPKPRRRRKRAAQARTESATEMDAPQGTDDEPEESDSSDTESDPELHEIDPNTVTMFEVSHDKKHGKTSERERRMAEIDWREVARKRREENDRIIVAAQQPSANEEVRETTEGAEGAADPPPPPPEGTGTVGGVRFHIVNGQIVADESSMTIDRQAQAQNEVLDDKPVEEENDLTININRTTWLHDRRRDIADRVPLWKRKSDPWSEEETDRFYVQLATYGTDFYMISTLFPPKTRRQIKAKFTREERLDPQRVTDALLGRNGTQRSTLNLENYARDTGRDVSDFTRFQNATHAAEVIRESLREREQEMRDAIRDEEAQEEAAREALAAREKGKKKAAERKEARAAAKERRAAGGVGGKRGGRHKGGGGLGGGGPVEETLGGAGAGGE